MTAATPDVPAPTDEVRRDALPLEGTESLDPLLQRIGEARYVLVGEATHGTHEFHRWRALLTRRLIVEKGFSFVAVEGDWPDCQAVHRCVTAEPGAPQDPEDVLWELERWPRWLWANSDVLDFLHWLRAYNRVSLPPDQRVGFFGLDVYSLWESLHAVLDHLREHDPDQVGPALEAFRCFEPYAADPQAYAVAARLVPADCEDQVAAHLCEVRERVQQAAQEGGLAEFAARQNAEVLAGAEQYYRSLLHGGPEAWNARDSHMTDTLERLMAYHGPQAKAVVWAHNTHVGDARATDMAEAGMISLGELVLDRHLAEGVVLVGFGSYQGTLIAADTWGAAPRVMRMPPARAASVEDLLTRALSGGDALFVFPPGHRSGRPAGRVHDAGAWQRQDWDHRAVGVVYHAGREQWGNYMPTVLSERYDAFLYLDRTHALTPLHQWDEGEGVGEKEEPTGG